MAAILFVAVMVFALIMILKEGNLSAGEWVLMAFAVFILLTGLGGMDRFTYGEYQGNFWETFDGSRWKYESGVGWHK